MAPGTGPEGYKVMPTSPANGSGMVTPLEWSITHDFFGDSVPSTRASVVLMRTHSGLKVYELK